MRYVVPLCLFAIVAGLFFASGGVGAARPNLQVAAEELDLGDDWTINPCKYTYQWWENEASVGTTISNLSDEAIEVDLGDGTQSAIPAQSSIEKEYKLPLKGQSWKIRITKLETQSSGVISQERLVLKILPRGGDKR